MVGGSPASDDFKRNVLMVSDMALFKKDVSDVAEDQNLKCLFVAHVDVTTENVTSDLQRIVEEL